ncbi:MAG: DNA replication/repair protein RecF [Halioglobus sp.]
MALNQLKIDGIRNLRDVSLEGLEAVNVFYGINGSGKTSVLEAIHLLGMARSFRGNSVKSVITHGEDSCVVYGSLAAPSTNKPALMLGIKRNRVGQAQIKVGGQPVRTVAELAEQLPLQVINADTFGLLTGSPSSRRQYLDWGVFHVEHAFFSEWQRFQRCIKQRNKLLRRGKLTNKELDIWTRDLAASGAAISDYRKNYFKELAPRFRAIMASLAPSLEELELHYRQGWDRQLSYAEALAQGVSADLEQGYTHTGPQRADLRVTTAGYGAAETLSRGQQKLVVCGLKLAQGQMMTELGKGSCTYLIDDLPSELDEAHSRLICQWLADMDAQVFITCVKLDEIRSVWPPNSPFGVFHVEQGSVVAAG